MSPAPNATSDPWEDLTEAERLAKEGHILDVTVWLMIFCIFTFFFIIVVASICMHWMEVRRYHGKGGFVLLPPGPVPACVTVLSSNQPHMKLIDHYHPPPSYCTSYGTSYEPSYSNITRSASYPSFSTQQKYVTGTRQ